MPEIIPDHVPSPRTLLAWDGTAYRPVLIDAAGHLQLDVVTILGLDGALQSVATDRLIVRGEDQLHSYKEVLASSRTAIISAANGFINSHACPAGVVWHVTNIAARDSTSAVAFIRPYQDHDGSVFAVGEVRKAFAANEYARFPVDLWLDHNDFFQCSFQGGLVGDTCRIDLLGEVMTKEV